MELMSLREIGVLFVKLSGEFVFCMFTSFIFIYLLLRIFSPRVVISEFISKNQDTQGNTRFIFKIINKSRFNAYNVKFFLARRVPYIVDGKSVNHQLIELPLTKNEVFSVPSFKRDKSKGDYAVLIGTTVDISQDIGVDHLEYELMVSVTHGLSNLTKVYKMKYKNKNKIFNRAFEFGNSTKIAD